MSLADAVLVTRPEPGLAETMRTVAALGWRPIAAPGLELLPKPFTPPRAQALLLTSRAAARAVPPLGLPVLAVGEATAAEARLCGHPDVTAAEGDAEALAALVRNTLQPADGPLLLAIGEGYGRELAAALRASGFAVQRRVAYAAHAARHLPAPALEALRQGRVGAALFFSPRTARASMALIRAAGLAEAARTIRAVAISRRVTDTLAVLPWAEVATATRPDHLSMMEALGEAR
ncbi:uroporphyrinogen-III synthase [Rhodovarius crocodyli]|nr:uroporphyrinogen-III synthase [Rhodovarius crocodyli]